ncbi:hypothetical protein A4H97_12400 [Niastella yeongjuensis]|uniref:AB hydrolase-1 domain-containing protein n=1 Tax=Niastella yeongjuensis TaxID=354355 RepID=A0A1V9EA15_9BACT|nr:alpha/beta hydrolase [Niastella yeongjuensis]OQP42946.1 hypothetical protein A4H97_12400 [Niastella yeongjuensis]SEO60501.1 proline iminopeptidase [Niastella yeongjuensis]
MRKPWFLICLLSFSFTELLAQKSYFITTPDKIKLYINEYGTGKPVVMLAGGPGINPGYLQPICHKMTGYRFIVPDQRGTGRSVMNNMDSLNLVVDKYVEDLEAVRVQLKLPKLTICGHSWGGMLAYAYAAKYPDKVERLVLLGPGGITPRFFAYFYSNINFRLHQEDRDEASHAVAGDLVAELKAIWPGYFFSRERALASKQLLDSSLANKGASKIDQVTTGNYNATTIARLNGLHNYKSPLYIIQGRQDPVGESTVYETAELVKQSKFSFIENCGHLPWLEEEKEASEFYELLDYSLKN